jgi:hypothetical protein
MYQAQEVQETHKIDENTSRVHHNPQPTNKSVHCKNKGCEVRPWYLGGYPKYWQNTCLRPHIKYFPVDCRELKYVVQLLSSQSTHKKLHRSIPMSQFGGMNIRQSENYGYQSLTRITYVAYVCNIMYLCVSVCMYIYIYMNASKYVSMCVSM